HSLFTHRLRWKLFLNQIVEIGLLSQLVVVITGEFTGAVFTAQTYSHFHKIGMGSAVGAVVSVAILRDLGSVLTVLMATVRVVATSSWVSRKRFASAFSLSSSVATKD